MFLSLPQGSHGAMQFPGPVRRCVIHMVTRALAGTKEAIEEQLRLGQELRRKVDRMEPAGGSETDASDADTDADSSGDDADDDGSKLGKSATAKARAAAAAILEGGYLGGLYRSQHCTTKRDPAERKWGVPPTLRETVQRVRHEVQVTRLTMRRVHARACSACPS